SLSVLAREHGSLHYQPIGPDSDNIWRGKTRRMPMKLGAKFARERVPTISFPAVRDRPGRLAKRVGRTLIEALLCRARAPRHPARQLLLSCRAPPPLRGGGYFSYGFTTLNL